MCFEKWFILWCVLFSGVVAAAEPADRFTSFAGFELESATTLADVVKVFGPAKLIETGDAGEYEALVCYSTPSAEYGFLSSEMGGSEHTLLGFSIALPAASRIDQCQLPSHSATSLVASIGGLTLGMTRAQFESLFGVGVEWRNDTGRVDYVFTSPMSADELERSRQSWPDVTKRPYFDVIVSVEGRFDKDVLVAARVWKVKSL